MVHKPSKSEKKITYDSKLCQLLDECNQILIVAADNVGSTQLQSIHKGVHGDSVVLMGKNTMMKRSIRIHAENTGNNAFLNLILLLFVSFTLSLFHFLFVSFIVKKLCFVWFSLLGQRGSDFHQGWFEGGQWRGRY